jgi:hypothetical protein
MVSQVAMLDECFLLCPYRIGTEERTAQVESSLAIVEIELLIERPVPLVGGGSDVVESESLALRLLGEDADHGLYLGIVSGTGGMYHFYRLDIVR